MRTFKDLVWDPPEGRTSQMVLKPCPREFKNNKDPKLCCRWKYPKEWAKPLWWYWQQIGIPEGPRELHPVGATWVEILTDFELSTRTMLNRGQTPSNIKKRSRDFAAASRRIVQICGGSFPKQARVPSLVPIGARFQMGLLRRPLLIYPRQTMVELAHQALVHKDALAQGAPTKAHWSWYPIYKCMPPMRWHANPDRIDQAVMSTPRRRLLGKRSWQAHCLDQTQEVPLEHVHSVAVMGEKGSPHGLRLVAKRLKARPPARPSGRSGAAPSAPRRATPY